MVPSIRVFLRQTMANRGTAYFNGLPLFAIAWSRLFAARDHDVTKPPSWLRNRLGTVAEPQDELRITDAGREACDFGPKSVDLDWLVEKAARDVLAATPQQDPLQSLSGGQPRQRVVGVRAKHSEGR